MILDDLIQAFSKLPGLGPKGASRIVYRLLSQDASHARHLGQLLIDLHRRLRTCHDCRNYSELELCHLCSDPRRDASLLCLVEQSQDVSALEATAEYQGLYFVLRGQLSPLDGIGPTELGLSDLLKLLERRPLVREVILATSFNTEGDATALYFAQLLKKRGLLVSRLASGLPVGSFLDYSDKLSLLRSLSGRLPL